MRIDRHRRAADQTRRLRTDITRAAFAKGVDGRVCGAGCTMECPKCGATGCQCACRPGCPQAPRQLSSDPENYPIEPAITPLVYEMKRLGMFRPCWSCEGHLGVDGALWKLPRVWFYCDSTAHVRLLADGVKELEMAGRLSTPWKVVVTYSDPDNPDTTFSLEPAPRSGERSTLTALRGDVARIAESLQTMISAQARKLQRQARTSLADAT